MILVGQSAATTPMSSHPGAPTTGSTSVQLTLKTFTAVPKTEHNFLHFRGALVAQGVPGIWAHPEGRRIRARCSSWRKAWWLLKPQHQKHPSLPADQKALLRAQTSSHRSDTSPSERRNGNSGTCTNKVENCFKPQVRIILVIFLPTDTNSSLKHSCSHRPTVFMKYQARCQKLYSGVFSANFLAVLQQQRGRILLSDRAASLWSSPSWLDKVSRDTRIFIYSFIAWVGGGETWAPDQTLYNSVKCWNIELFHSYLNTKYITFFPQAVKCATC